MTYPDKIYMDTMLWYIAVDIRNIIMYNLQKQAGAKLSLPSS